MNKLNNIQNLFLSYMSTENENRLPPSNLVHIGSEDSSIEKVSGLSLKNKARTQRVNDIFDHVYKPMNMCFTIGIKNLPKIQNTDEKKKRREIWDK